MPAGTYAAGQGAAGHDPTAPLAARPVITPVAAAFFDPAQRDFPLDAHGHVRPVHPVDQAVTFALTLTQNSVGSAPGLGHTLRTLPRGNAALVANAARDAVRRALAPLTARGDVTLLAVSVDTSLRGRVLVTVTYRNERLPQSPPKTAQGSY